jgi:polysaccharide biosynthesis protein PslF
VSHALRPSVLHLAPEDPGESGIAAYAERFRGDLGRAGADVRTVKVDRHGAPNSVAAVRRYVEAALSAARPDVVHAELGGVALREFYAARALARSRDVPVFLTLHDPPWPVWWPFHVRSVREFRPVRGAVAAATSRAAAGLERGLLRAAAGLFVLSGSGATRTREVHGAGRLPPVVVLPFPVESAPAARGRSGPPGELVLGFFGYWYQGKGIELLAEAVGRLNASGVPTRLRLWGDVLPASGRAGHAYRAKVRSVVERLGGQVEVHGHLPPAEVPAALAACDAVVLPYHSSPRTADMASASASMHAALSTGTPVVASAMRGLSDLVRHGDNGLLVPEGDAHALTEALRRLDGDAALRDRLRAGAARTAAQLRAADPGASALAAYAAAL